MTAPHKTFSSTSATIKLLCSYGGKILPRPSDRRLRYVGGLTRVVSVHRSVSFSELMVKLGELCGYSVAIRCQLPTEDLDVLVSVKSDEDLANVIEEYDKASSITGRELKIRAILSSPKSKTSATRSPASSSSSSSSGADISPSRSDRVGSPATAVDRRFPPRKAQHGVLRDCYYYYPCHLQTNSQPSSYFGEHSNHWH